MIHFDRKTCKREIANSKRTKDGYITYIIMDRWGFFKVGRTKDIKSRIRQIKNSNPHVIVCKIIDFDCENEIHAALDRCRYKLEWFEFITDYKEISYPVLSVQKYSYFNICLLVHLIKKNGVPGLKIFSSIIFDRFKHIYIRG